MTKRDYTKFSSKKDEEVIEQVSEEIIEDEPAKQVIGIVSNCKKLNVRKHPSQNAEVLCEIPCDLQVVIEENESTEDFYKVCTFSGIEGFCMKKFIMIDQ